MKETTHPRILILSDQIPHSVSAGNIQLLRLFADYLPENLLAIGPPVPKGALQLECRYLGWQPSFTRLNNTRFTRWKRSLRAVNVIPAASPNTIQRMLNGFRPDVVLNIMENSDYYEVAAKFCRVENLPLVIICHDTNEDFEPVYSWAQRALFEKDRRIYRSATARFCVSPEMVQFNEARFGVPGEVLYPIPDPALQPRPVEMSATLRQPPYLTIGYAGALAYGYGEMILKLLPLFEKVGVRLELCTPKPAGIVAGLLGHAIVRWHGYMPSSKEAMELLQERCDALLLPYLDPPGSYERLYSTHFPSKLCDYLQLGMPIIVTGPSLATGVKWWHRMGNSGSDHSAEEVLHSWKCRSEERIRSAERSLSLRESFGLGNIETQIFFKRLESFRKG